MIAVLFIIFDIETVFMIPWGAHFRQLSCSTELVDRVCPAGAFTPFGLIEMGVFILILFVGYVYVWKKGALQWD
jgi:NADH-quinone oxidoreductase subunit A